MVVFLFDLWVFVLPISFVLVFVFVGAVLALQFPVPREFGHWFAFIVVGNVLQLSALAAFWWREYSREKEDSVLFWGKVLKRYLFMGGALYYFYHVRDWLLRSVDRESYQRGFWKPFVRSRITHVLRLINRVWLRLFIVELLMGWGLAALRLDVGLEVFIALVGVTVALGVPVSSYLMFVVVRDAAIRWRGTPEERKVAMRVFSRYYWYYLFHWYLDVEAYFQAVAALESPHAK